MYSSAPIRFDLLLCLAGKILPTQPPGRGRGAGIAGGGRQDCCGRTGRGWHSKTPPCVASGSWVSLVYMQLI